MRATNCSMCVVRAGRIARLRQGQLVVPVLCVELCEYSTLRCLGLTVKPTVAGVERRRLFSNKSHLEDDFFLTKAYSSQQVAHAIHL